MNGWTGITGGKQRVELDRVVVEKKKEKSVDACNLHFLAEEAEIDEVRWVWKTIQDI